MKTLSSVTSLLALALLSCSDGSKASAASGSVEIESFGQLPDGTDVKIFTLTNKDGMVAKVTEYGAILVSLEVPDKDGTVSDVTHGYDTLDGWLTNTSYFGATVGRYGNRIANGKFSLDGEEYTLAIHQ